MDYVLTNALMFAFNICSHDTLSSIIHIVNVCWSTAAMRHGAVTSAGPLHLHHHHHRQSARVTDGNSITSHRIDLLCQKCSVSHNAPIVNDNGSP